MIWCRGTGDSSSSTAGFVFNRLHLLVSYALWRRKRKTLVRITNKTKELAPPISGAQPVLSEWSLYKARSSSWSKMYLRGTHDRSSGLYPSQSTRNCCPPPRWCTSRMRWTMWATTPSIVQMGRGGLGGKLSCDSKIGLTCDTWKVLWSLNAPGSFRCNAMVLSIRSTLKGPI